MWRLLVALTSLASLSQGEEYCYSSDRNPYRLTGSKTSYSILPHQPLTKIPNSPEYGHCRPVMVWVVGKHGLNWPPNVARDKYASFLPSLKQNLEEQFKDKSSQLCNHDQNLIKSWKPKIMDESQGLHPTGVNEVKQFANRIKKGFPRLFSKPFTSNNYIVQYGKTEWPPTYDTANVFIEAIFGRQTLTDYPPIKDLVEDLQKCRSKSHLLTQEGLDPLNPQNNVVLQQSFEALRLRLGFQQLDQHQLNAIFFACAEEIAWYPQKKSPWCALLTPQDIQAQEYAEDIEYYYSTAYMNGFSRKAACPFIKDMIDRFRLYRDNPTAKHPSGIFYFGFSKHVNLVATALGLMYEKTPLSLDRMDPSRKYRSSKFLGYQGNLIAVLHECRTIQTPIRKTYKVKFFLNELPVDPGDVDLETLIQKYSSYVDSGICNYDFCFNNTLARQEFRASNPNPLGVDLTSTVDLGEKANMPFSESEGMMRRVKGMKWYWWILITPLVLITCVSVFGLSTLFLL